MGECAPALWDIVDEHLDNAGFLWECWERALESPTLRPAQVATVIEERLLASLDGLEVDAAIERILAPALVGDDDTIVAPAALALLALPEGLGPVLDALRAADGRRRSALTRALALSRRPGLQGDLLGLLRGGEEPSVAAAALEALAFRRMDVGPPLLELLKSQVPELQRAALRAARSSEQAVRHHVERACTSRVAEVRDAAIETGLLLDLRFAHVACQRLVDSGEPDSGFALATLAIGGDPADAPRIEGALKSPASRAPALVALGYAGRAASVERILEWAADAKLARLAGEAFSAITGAAIDGPLRAEPAHDEELPPLEDDDLDADLDPGPEGELPVPDAEHLEDWWRREAKRFDPGRHLDGITFAPEVLLKTFLSAPMRRRRLLGLELAVRSRREYWVETGDWASEQLREQQRRQLTIRSEARLPFSKLLRT
jgi:uncharacterized protein (TIGR02270 family)